MYVKVIIPRFGKDKSMSRMQDSVMDSIKEYFRILSRQIIDEN